MYLQPEDLDDLYEHARDCVCPQCEGGGDELIPELDMADLLAGDDNVEDDRDYPAWWDYNEGETGWI